MIHKQYTTFEAVIGKTLVIRTFCIFFTSFQTFLVKAIGYQTKLLSQHDLESKN